MPCLLGCLSLSVPRFVLLLVFLFSDYLGRAYATNIVPFFGFLFMPLTTLAYAAVKNEHGQVTGIYLAIVILAALMDLGIIGIGRGGMRRRSGGPEGREITIKGERVG